MAATRDALKTNQQRTASPRTRLAFSLLVLVSLSGACVEEPPACYDGDFIACDCGSEPGFQQCLEGVFGACTCDGGIPGLVGTGGAGGTTSVGGSGQGGKAELLPFMSPCDHDAQCATGLCFQFNAKGPHCTSPCATDDECPPPSTGCNNMGVCKAP